MSERKVINRYIPPDYNPNDRFSLPRGPKRPRTVRVMLPFSLRCSTCGEFIYKGRKFNARKETADGEGYLGIAVFRFYIRCSQCSSEITYLTDPQNADYSIEQGATRNAEPWRQEERESEAAKVKRRFEEEMNPMKALENKTMDAKRDIDTAEAIEDLRARKAELERLQSSMLLQHSRPTANPRASQTELPELTAEDEEKARHAFCKPRQHQSAPGRQQPACKRLDASSLGITIRPKESMSSSSGSSSSKRGGC